jgi:hypothetical protein
VKTSVASVFTQGKEVIPNFVKISSCLFDKILFGDNRAILTASIKATGYKGYNLSIYDL